MKFTTYLRDDAPRLAAIDGADLIDLNDANAKTPADMRLALKAGIDLKAAAQAAVKDKAARQPLAAAKLAPLVPEPGKIVCLGLNYFDHAKEGGRDKPEYPWFFFRAASSQVAHGEAGWLPQVSTKFDYEAELAVVIGKTVPRHTKEADALQYVFGYACYNDMSVRDYQKRTPQWTIGKNFDATGAFGPCIVTADELPPGAAGLHIESRLNGQVMQSATTSDMVFDVARTITLLSACMTSPNSSHVSALKRASWTAWIG